MNGLFCFGIIILAVEVELGAIMACEREESDTGEEAEYGWHALTDDPSVVLFESLCI